VRDGETHCYGLDPTVVPPVSGEILRVEIGLHTTGEREGGSGGANLVVWKNDLWALDHYPRLREVLDAECQVVASTLEVKVYAISGGR
jgi:hypothetical protein